MGSDTESTPGPPGKEVEALGHWARQDPQAQALPCGSPVTGQIADHLGAIFKLEYNGRVEVLCRTRTTGRKGARAKANW